MRIALIIGLTIFLNKVHSGELIPLITPPSDHFHRCTYLSESHKVVHNFQIKQTYPYRCFYSIEVDDKPFKEYTASSQPCEQFIRDQINRGSVCINNFIY